MTEIRSTEAIVAELDAGMVAAREFGVSVALMFVRHIEEAAAKLREQEAEIARLRSDHETLRDVVRRIRRENRIG